MSYAGMGQTIQDAPILAIQRLIQNRQANPNARSSRLPPPAFIPMIVSSPSVGVATVSAGPRVGVATVSVASASPQIANAAIAKAEVDRLFRAYQATPYLDPAKRNSLRRDLLAAGRKLVSMLMLVRPATEQERLRLRTIAASALVSSLLRQRCFMSGASNCGGFAMNEDSGRAKTNAEFVAITRPLDVFIKTRNTVPVARPTSPFVIQAQGTPVRQAPPSKPAQDAVAVSTEAADMAAIRLNADRLVSQAATNDQTRLAADRVIIAQAGVDAAAKAAKEEAERAQAAAAIAAQAIQAAQATGTAVDAHVAQVAEQGAQQAQAVAEQATVAVAEIATVADAVRSELEAVATATNDVPAQQATTNATMTVAVATSGHGPLGISWMAWGVGAAALVGGYLLLNSKKSVSANRRSRRSRRRR